MGTTDESGVEHPRVGDLRDFNIKRESDTGVSDNRGVKDLHIRSWIPAEVPTRWTRQCVPGPNLRRV